MVLEQGVWEREKNTTQPPPSHQTTTPFRQPANPLCQLPADPTTATGAPQQPSDPPSPPIAAAGHLSSNRQLVYKAKAASEAQPPLAIDSFNDFLRIYSLLYVVRGNLWMFTSSPT